MGSILSSDWMEASKTLENKLFDKGSLDINIRYKRPSEESRKSKEELRKQYLQVCGKRMSKKYGEDGYEVFKQLQKAIVPSPFKRPALSKKQFKKMLQQQAERRLVVKKLRSKPSIKELDDEIAEEVVPDQEEKDEDYVEEEEITPYQDIYYGRQ